MFHRMIIATLAALLLSAIAGMIYLYPRAMRPLVRPRDDAVVDRARRDSDLAFGDSVADRPDTFPIVVRLADRTCVELRSSRVDRAGNYLVCYDAQNGRKLEERATVGF